MSRAPRSSLPMPHQLKLPTKESYRSDGATHGTADTNCRCRWWRWLSRCQLQNLTAMLSFCCCCCCCCCCCGYSSSAPLPPPPAAASSSPSPSAASVYCATGTQPVDNGRGRGGWQPQLLCAHAGIMSTGTSNEGEGKPQWGPAKPAAQTSMYKPRAACRPWAPYVPS